MALFPSLLVSWLFCGDVSSLSCKLSVMTLSEQNKIVSDNTSLDTSYSVLVDEESVGLRLDKFLNNNLSTLSRTRIKNLLEEGFVKEKTSGLVVKDPARKVRMGELFILVEPEAVDAIPQAQNIPLDIVFEDQSLLIVNKPAGMVVHPANGHEAGTLVNALLYHSRDSLSGIGGVKRPGIVHRIDKDTSGLLVVAKNDQAHKGLSILFHDHDIVRSYQAIVKGRIQPLAGSVEGNIARHPNNRKKMAVSADRGKTAITHYKTDEVFMVGNGALASSITCTLETGRTHQIRVHMAHLGHPLIGDGVYGRKLPKQKNATPELQSALANFNRQALHAAILGFKHPITGEMLQFEAPLPHDMQNLINLLKQG